MERRPSGAVAVFAIALAFATALTGCGGDGGPHPPPPQAPGPGPGRTTFRGNLARMTALQQRHNSRLSEFARELPLSFADEANAQETGVQVCLDETTLCASTDDSGEFVLVAPVSGNISLIFSGADFTARLGLTGVPMGSVITIRNIECSTSSGRCTPQQLDIEAPMPTDVPPVNLSPGRSPTVANADGPVFDSTM